MKQLVHDNVEDSKISPVLPGTYLNLKFTGDTH